MSEWIDQPETPYWCFAAEQYWGWTWCLLNTDVICPQCILGLAGQHLVATCADYYHFAGDLHQVLDMVSRLTADYIRHALTEHSPESVERVVMDSSFITFQAAYLDVLHPKANGLTIAANEARTVHYRLINSSLRQLALLASLEGPSGLSNDDIDAVGLAALVMHDSVDRRHDTAAGEAFNLFTLVTAHRGFDSTDMLRQFCVDVWAWHLDHGRLWPLLLAGRLALWHCYMPRYNGPQLLDQLTAPDRKPLPRYGDPVLDGLNPLPPASDGEPMTVRARCQNPDRHDHLVRDCRNHIAECPGCRGFEEATWQQRLPIISQAYRRKHGGDGTCLTWLSLHTILLSSERFWWAADPTSRYTGTTEAWSTLLV